MFQTLYITCCEFESLSDDGVLQVGDWHHLKITVKLAAGSSTTDNHHVVYRVVVNEDTWALSANTSGNSYFIGYCLHTVSCCTVSGIVTV